MLFAIGAVIGALAMQTWDGREITLSHYDSRAGTVVVFMSSRCPVTQGNIKGLLQVHEKYRRREVLFVGLCVNEEETPDEMKAFRLRNDVNFPVYRDPKCRIAKKFGARFTPEAFLIDRKGALVCRGGFQSAGAIEEMDNSIAGLLIGKEVPRGRSSEKGTPLSEIGSPVPADDPVEPIAFSSELVFEKIPWAVDHHCSTLAEAPNGDLLCVWYGGSYECADDQALYLARREHGQHEWHAPELVTRGEFLHPPGNAVVFRVSPSRLMILYDRMDEPRPIRNGRWREGQLVAIHSDDDGRTWSAAEEVHAGPGGIRNAPFALENGELFVPMSNPKPCFLMTRDGGANWRVSGSINVGGQPTAVQRSDGSLLCYLRAQPMILQSESLDGGATWSVAQPSKLPCPGASMAMRRLANGHLVLVYNPSSESRTPISVAVSKDDGNNWSRPVHLDSNPGEYAYPCVIQTEDGNVHVSYTFLRKTIKHVEFNELWLTTMSGIP